MLRTLVLVTCLAATAACLEARYTVQASLGQAELLASGRSIDDLLRDPSTDPRTRALLRETRHVLRFAAEHGLEDKGNYQRYVDLGRGAVVWFLTACDPLSFEEKTWSFPIAGSFPYLGWFERRAADDYRRRLRADGYDVYVRPVSAYSTGGWFNDPVLSTMLSDGDTALRDLINVLLHELTHANIFVPNQSAFVESLATFVGDGMAADYLAWRFGESSTQLALYRTELAESRRRGGVLTAAYRELEAIYASERSDADKRGAKRTILARVERELDLSILANNAFLIGFKTYNTGHAELEALFSACDRDWPRFLSAVATLEGDDFDEEQSERFGALLLGLRDRCAATSRSARSP